MSHSRFFTVFALIALIVSGVGAEILQDGILQENEYPGIAEFADGDFIVHWSIEGDKVDFAIEATSPGWVALGFDPRSVMDQADMVFGSVPEDGQGSVLAMDAFSDGVYGPHPADTDSGGKDDIIAFGGKREGDKLIFEFSRALDTGDSRDKVLPVSGQIPIIWAIGYDEDFFGMHERAGSGSLDLTLGTGSRRRSVGGALVAVHIALMSLSFLGMLTGMIVARYFKTKKFWLKVHRPLGVASALAGFLGLVIAFLMVQFSGGPHLRVPHGIAGLFTMILCLAMPALGFAIFAFKGPKAGIKKVHRILGRITILAMALVIVSGLITAGIIRL